MMMVIKSHKQQNRKEILVLIAGRYSLFHLCITFIYLSVFSVSLFIQHYSCIHVIAARVAAAVGTSYA